MQLMTAPSGAADQDETDVLIVDDDEDIRDLLSEWLRSYGYTVDVVGDGLRALEYLSTHRPKVVILDIMMPVMDGWAFLDRRDADPGLHSVPIVIASANLDLMKDRDIAEYDKISKPFDTGQLLRLVEKWVRR